MLYAFWITPIDIGIVALCQPRFPIFLIFIRHGFIRAYRPRACIMAELSDRVALRFDIGKESSSLLI